MSLWLGRYVRLKNFLYKTKPVDFTKTLRCGNNILIHPVMEPGREIFSFPTIETIVKHKKKAKVELLIDEKLKFFFNDMPAQKIYYRDFTSSFSSSYKRLKEKLKEKKYDIFVELNRFTDEKMILFGSAVGSKIRMSLDGVMESPIFNMVITSAKAHNDIERNNLILQPLGINRARTKINWGKHSISKRQKRKIGIAIDNNKIALKTFSFLKERNFYPVLFVKETRRFERMKQRIGDSLLSIYPLEKLYEECILCESIISSVNLVSSIGALLKKKMLVLLEGKEEFYPLIDRHIELFSPDGSPNEFYPKIKDFIGGK